MISDLSSRDIHTYRPSILVRAIQYFMSFTTRHGIKYYNSPKCRSHKSGVESWTEWLADFWLKHKQIPRDKTIRCLKNRIVRLVDKQEVLHLGTPSGGYTTATESVITTLDKNNKVSTGRVKYLFLHETSHVILARVGNMPIYTGADVENHHQEFIKYKLREESNKI